MVMLNDLDRFHLVMDVIDRVPAPRRPGGAPAPGDGRRPAAGPRLHPRARRGPARGARTGPGRSDAGEPAAGRVLVVNAGSSSLKVSVGRGRASPWNAWTGSATASGLLGCGRRRRPPRRPRRPGPRRAGGGRRRRRAAPAATSRTWRRCTSRRACGGSTRPGGCCRTCPHVACFDTAFHRTIPAAASTHALPAQWRRPELRRYGFHGLSHAWASRRAAELRARRSARRGLPPRRGGVAVRRARRPLGRHHDGLHAARRAGDGHPQRVGRPGPAAVAAGARARRRSPSSARRWSTAPGCRPRRHRRHARAAAPVRGRRRDARLAVDVYVHRLAGARRGHGGGARRARRPRVHRRRGRERRSDPGAGGGPPGLPRRGARPAPQRRAPAGRRRVRARRRRHGRSSWPRRRTWRSPPR